MDEIASWVVFIKCRTTGFTKGLSVEYDTPVRVDKGTLTLSASLERMERNIAVIPVQLVDGEGTLCSRAEARYFTIPAKIAEKRGEYPGIEAFFSRDS